MLTYFEGFSAGGVAGDQFDVGFWGFEMFGEQLYRSSVGLAFGGRGFGADFVAAVGLLGDGLVVAAVWFYGGSNFHNNFLIAAASEILLGFAHDDFGGFGADAMQFLQSLAELIFSLAAFEHDEQ